MGALVAVPPGGVPLARDDVDPIFDVYRVDDADQELGAREPRQIALGV